MRRALVLSFALLPGLAGADQVYTRGGGQLVGEIVESGPDSIVVDIGGGTIGLPLSYVERIVPGPSPIAQYRKKAERLAADDTAGWLALAEWARQQGLRPQADEAFLRVVSNDPDNPTARQALEHVKVGAQWMTREEGYRAQGLVAFEGRWITPDERDTLLAERKAALERPRAETDAVVSGREGDARARTAEAQARVAEADARIAEVDAGRAESAAANLAWLPIGAGFPTFSFIPVHPCVVSGCTPHHRGRDVVPDRPLTLAERMGSAVVSPNMGPRLQR